VIEENLILSETEFDKFQRYCRENGFDLSYYSSSFSGSEKEIQQQKFDEPVAIKLIKHRFTSVGKPYTVAEWEQVRWHNQFKEIQQEFFKNKMSANSTK
jgi:hypothetical protein